MMPPATAPAPTAVNASAFPSPAPPPAAAAPPPGAAGVAPPAAVPARLTGFALVDEGAGVLSAMQLAARVIVPVAMFNALLL